MVPAEEPSVGQLPPGTGTSPMRAITRFHYTEHGTRRRGDALHLFEEQTILLEQLIGEWKRTVPRETRAENAFEAKWDHGTVGKLLLEHCAVRLAASCEIVRVLRTSGQDEIAQELDAENQAVRPIVVRMYDSGRGVQPISLAITPDFIEAVDDLETALRGGFTG